MHQSCTNQPSFRREAVHDGHVVGSGADATIDDHGHVYAAGRQEAVDLVQRDGRTRVIRTNVAGDVDRACGNGSVGGGGQFAENVGACVTSAGEPTAAYWSASAGFRQGRRSARSPDQRALASCLASGVRLKRSEGAGTQQCVPATRPRLHLQRHPDRHSDHDLAPRHHPRAIRHALDPAAHGPGAEGEPEGRDGAGGDQAVQRGEIGELTGEERAFGVHEVGDRVQLGDDP